MKRFVTDSEITSEAIKRFMDLKMYCTAEQATATIKEFKREIAYEQMSK